MKTSIVIVIIFGLLAVGCTTTYLNLKENSPAQIEEKIIDYQANEDVGTEVILSINNGEEISGELLSVRESSLTICTKYSATEYEIANLNYPIIIVRNDEIQEMKLEGSNYVLAGFGIGIAAGAGIGYLVGLASEQSHNAYVTPEAIGFVLGFIVGAIAGSIIGYSLSTEEYILQEISPDYNWSILKPLTRYQDEEPEYLRAIE